MIPSPGRGVCEEKPRLIDDIADAIKSRDHVFDLVRELSTKDETEKLADLLLRCVNPEKTGYARRAYRHHAYAESAEHGAVATFKTGHQM